MDAGYVELFSSALARGDVALALSLLENGRVTVRSLSPLPGGSVPELSPLIFSAVFYEREPVVRALVRLGSKLDELCNVNGQFALSPAGFAISLGSISMLSLCHRLGSNMSCVARKEMLQSSSVDFAICVDEYPDCLAYLLDNVYPARPVDLGYEETMSLCSAASQGSAAKAIFKVLESRGFDFMLLEKMRTGIVERGPSCADVMLADVMLTAARGSGDACFLRYLVKDLGLAGTTGGIDIATHRLEVGHAKLCEAGSVLWNSYAPRPGAPLTKYECVVCETVGASASKICAGCKVARYCSSKCQTSHWKVGGHKKECKEIQRRPKQNLSGAAGSSES